MGVWYGMGMGVWYGCMSGMMDHSAQDYPRAVTSKLFDAFYV